MRAIITVISLVTASAAFGQDPEEGPAERTEAAREEPAENFTSEDRAQTDAATEGVAGDAAEASDETAVEEVVQPPAQPDSTAEPAGVTQDDAAESATESPRTEDPQTDTTPADLELPPAPPPQAVPEGGADAAAQDLAEGSAEAGQAKSATCAACHGADGNSFNPEWPSLAGQHAEYIVQQLEAYQSGARQDVLMTSQAQGLSEQDMRDLAAYYTRHIPQLRTADPELARLGEDIYRGGNPETGVSACIACHGPTGGGNPAASYPLVRGQHAVYLAGELEAYATDERRSDPNQMMRNIAVLLDDNEIAAVTSFMQGLRSK
ncbi:MAG: c-type cytochrome [Gammaproteobacteria bacterium]|nr:c-type cytochrome [Gammaproteobacteria bacterium]